MGKMSHIVCSIPSPGLSCNTRLHPFNEGDLLLGISALHYSTGSWDSEGVWTVASACALCQPTIAHLGISIISIWKSGNQSVTECSLNRGEHRVSDYR